MENESFKNGINQSKYSEFLNQDEEDGGAYKKDILPMLRKHYVVPEDMRLYDKKFNPLQQQIPYHAIGNTREYLFFTKPDLHIITPGQNTLQPALYKNIFWQDMFYRYRRVISDLQVSARRHDEHAAHDRHIFIPMLTNMVAGNLELPSSTAETTETAQTIYGTSIQYRKSSMKSDEGYDFSLDFNDAPWLDVYNFFKMWDEYETLKDLGEVGPPNSASDRHMERADNIRNKMDGKKTKNKKKDVTATANSKAVDNTKKPADTTGYYRINKILHDQIAIFKFIVDGADMSTILYYAKLTGCFPKSVPRDAFGNFKGEGLIQYSIDWHAQFVEDMNPIILVEFNRLCQSYFTNEVAKDRLKRPSRNMVDKPWEGGYVSHPYIIADTVPEWWQLHKSKKVNKLVWYE